MRLARRDILVACAVATGAGWGVWLLSGSLLGALLAAVCGGVAPWILREPRYGLIGILVTLPLDRFGRLVTAPVTVTAYHAMLVLTIVGWIGGLLRERRLPRLSTVGAAMGLLLFAAVWSLPTSLAPAATAVAAVRIAFSVVLVVLVTDLVTDERWMRRIGTAFAVTAVVSAVIAVVQSSWPAFPVPMIDAVVSADGSVVWRARALFKDANYLGVLLAAAIAGFAAMAAHARGRRAVVGWVAAAGVCAVALFLTLSRGSWIALFAGLVAAALTAPRRRRAAIVSAGVTLLVATLLLAPATLRDRAVSSFDIAHDASAATRYYMYVSAAEMFRDHPVFGVGLAAFEKAYPRYQRAQTMQQIVRPHEVPVALAAETGVPGVLAQVALVVAVVIELRRRRGTTRTVWGSVVVAGLATFAAGVFFEYLLYIEYVWLFVALAVVAGRIAPAAGPEGEGGER